MIALALASFAEAGRFADAVAGLRAEGRTIVGLWSPLPVPAVGAGMAGAGIVRAAALTGAAAATALYLLEWWSAAHAYPFDSGARPLASWQAFLVAPIELGALAAAAGGAVAWLRRAALPRLHHPAFDIDEVEAASRDRFVVAIRCEAGADANALLARLAEAGAVHSRVAER